MPAKTIEIDFENFKVESLTREEASEYLGVKKVFLRLMLLISATRYLTIK